jgi:hypothetical protein
MEVEAALAPPQTRLNAASRQYALRALKLAENHPIFKEIWAKSKANSQFQDYLVPTQKEIAKMTQIKRIRYSIYSLVQFQYLESISSFKFPPWATILYTIEISKLSKELEAENHKNSAILLAPNQYSVYTDGSELVDQKGIGIGLALFNSNQELIQSSSWNIGTSQLVYNGELAGIAEGIKLVSEIAQKDQEFIIFSDNQAALQRLKLLNDKSG